MARDPFQYFRIEARELLEMLSRGAMDLEKGQISRELIADLLRQAHTLKGAARVVKQVEMANLAHAMEEVLTPHRGAAGPVPREEATRLLRLVDACGERLRELLEPAEPASGPFPPVPTEEPFTSVRVDIAEMDALLSELTEASVHLRAVTMETAELNRAERGADQLLHALAAPSGELAVHGGPTLAIGELLSLAEEVSAEVRLRRRTLNAKLERAQRDLSSLRERAGDLRLSPVNVIVPYLERGVRDTADSVNKRVHFAVEGGDHRLDTHVLVAARDALLHVVRNAVAHGIEPELERVAANKPTQGQVSLRVRKLGQQVSFVVEDDGRGLDMAAIGRIAIGKGLLTPTEAENLTEDSATQLLLRGGLTTSSAASEVAGRGIGLDVVRSTAVRLKGTVSVRSQRGRGLSVELVVPVSLESMAALAVIAGGRRFFLPFTAIHRALRLSGNELSRSPSGVSLVDDGQAIPFQALEELLGAARPRSASAQGRTAIVVRVGTVRAAIGVDNLGGIRDVAVRPLPALCGQAPFIAGAVLNEEGDPELALDPVALVAALQSARPQALTPAPAQQLPLLVVDDSLTTRMLEQSILEAAGFAVDLANSGEEALEKARQRSYALFIVDVEMPGMNGFELLEQFRNDPQCRGTPAIMVTSRAAPEDRLRGERVGARDYIVKSEFHEGRLLRTIRDLVGSGGAP